MSIYGSGGEGSEGEDAGNNQQYHKKKHHYNESEDELDEEDLALVEENAGYKVSSRPKGGRFRRLKRGRQLAAGSDEDDEEHDTVGRGGSDDDDQLGLRGSGSGRNVNSALFGDDDEDDDAGYSGRQQRREEVDDLGLFDEDEDEDLPEANLHGIGRHSSQKKRNDKSRYRDDGHGDYDQRGMDNFIDYGDEDEEGQEPGATGGYADDYDQPGSYGDARDQGYGGGGGGGISSGLGGILGDMAYGIDEDILYELSEIFGTGQEYEYAMRAANSHDEYVLQSKTLEEVFEPGELAAQMMTEQDEEIRLADIPERMLTRSTQLNTSRKLQEDEITDEVTWAVNYIKTRQAWGIKCGPPEGYLLETHCLAGMLAVFKLLSSEFCEVPYISHHRRDMFVTPLDSGEEENEDRVKEWLSDDDLWLLYDLDLQYRSLLHRRENVKSTVKKLMGQANKRNDPTHILSDIEDNDDDGGQGKSVYPNLLKDGHQEYINGMLESSTCIEEANDIMQWIQVEYFQELIQISNRHGESKKGINKRPSTTTSIWETAKRNDIDKFIQENLGITPRQFGETLNNINQHYVDDHSRLDKPEKVAEGYLTREFPNPKMVIKVATAYLAQMLALDPHVKRYVRAHFHAHAHIWVWPTKRGKVEISHNEHPYFAFKYLRPKPVAEFANSSQILKILKAESEGLVRVGVGLSDVEKAPRFEKSDEEIWKLEQRAIVDEFASEMERMIQSDAVHESAEAWNLLRGNGVRIALDEHLLPAASRWVLGKLKSEAELYIARHCQSELEKRIDVQPALSNRMQEKDIPRVVAVVGGGFAPSSRGALRIMYVDDQGRYVEHFTADTLRLKPDPMESENPSSAIYGMDAQPISKGDGVPEFFELLEKYQPDIVAVSGLAPQTMRLLDDVREVVRKYCSRSNDDILVTMVNDEAARLYWTSEKAKAEFPYLKNEERYAISVARSIQSPLREYAALGLDGLATLIMHPDQKLLPTELLKSYLERALVKIVNQVGVDINAAAKYEHHQHLLQYVCGLGPRKAKVLVNKIKNLPNHMLDSRSDLIREGIMTRTVFINSASFLQILPQGIDVLDTTRIHPEDYELARKMATDALDIEDDDEDDDIGYRGHGGGPSRHVDALLRGDTYRLDDLILTEYNRELERMLHVPKLESLKFIKRELKNPNYEKRRKYVPPGDQEIFDMLTGEKSKETLKDDGTTLVAVSIQRVLPRFAIGTLDSGVEAFIGISNISEQRIDSVTDILSAGQSVAGVIKAVNYQKLSVDVSILDSDVTIAKEEHIRQQNEISLSSIDTYFDLDAEKQDRELRKAKSRISQGRLRQIQHPWFKAMNSVQAEAYLADRPRGSYVIRSSSRGMDHIAITWKVGEGIFQHLDVVEKDKPNEMAVGRILNIGKSKFSDLDELAALHIDPVSHKIDEARRHPKFYDPIKDLLSSGIVLDPPSNNKEAAAARVERLQEQIKEHLDALSNSTGRGAYCLCYSYKHPGSLQIVFKSTPRSRNISHRTVRVLPDAYLLDDKHRHPTVDSLINGFKTIQMKAGENRNPSRSSNGGPPNVAPDARQIQSGLNGGGGYSAMSSPGRPMMPPQQLTTSRMAINNSIGATAGAIVPRPQYHTQKTTPPQPPATNTSNTLIMHEEFDHYLYGGYQNRLTLALRSGLPNEIDWACHKLVRVSHGCPENYDVLGNCPLLVEAIIETIGKCRATIRSINASEALDSQINTNNNNNNNNNGNSSSSSIDMYTERLKRSSKKQVAHDRACMLMLSLRNFCHLGLTARKVVADPRVTEELLQWLQSSNSINYNAVIADAEMTLYCLDVFEALCPFYQPIVLAQLIHPNVSSDSRNPSRSASWPYSVDPKITSNKQLRIMLREIANTPRSIGVRLWKALANLFLYSNDRGVQVGAMYSIALIIFTNPQLTKHLLPLPLDNNKNHSNGSETSFPSRTFGAAIAQKCSQYVMVNDLELSYYSLDLLGEIVRLDMELRTQGLKKSAIKHKPRKRRLHSSNDRPVIEHTWNVAPGSDHEKSSSRSDNDSSLKLKEIPSILPNGLTSLMVSLGIQWEQLLPEQVIASAKSRYVPPPAAPLASSKQQQQQQTGGGPPKPGTSGPGGAAATSNGPGKPDAQNRPTEAELREACTWVLMNYEATNVPTDVAVMTDMFQRYTVAKRAQTVPHIGRALFMHEMFQVVKAVFPKATCQNVSAPNQPGATTILVRGIKQKNPKILPIVAIPVEQGQTTTAGSQSVNKSQQAGDGATGPQKPNHCQWLGCDYKFTSETDAKSHLTTVHIPKDRLEGGWTCLWGGCKRFAKKQAVAGTDSTADNLDTEPSRLETYRHCLTHGPFYKSTGQTPPPPQHQDTPKPNDGSHTPKTPASNQEGTPKEKASVVAADDNAMDVEPEDDPDTPSIGAVSSNGTPMIANSGNPSRADTPASTSQPATITSPASAKPLSSPNPGNQGINAKNTPPPAVAATASPSGSVSTHQPKDNISSTTEKVPDPSQQSQPQEASLPTKQEKMFWELSANELPWEWPIRLRQPAQIHENIGKTMSILTRLAQWDEALSQRVEDIHKKYYEKNQKERARVVGYDNSSSSTMLLNRLAALADQRPTLAEFAFRVAAMVKDDDSDDYY
ncbi:Transcription elongation factor spt6 [Mycoemilia scoparia]|uniref:Transcription elongation factor SPT6 n=1 Tax=Mycoemilia scoparia TaxID=417184 RepID=A0A9W8A020_9FUNG|nr:Transcription elongation factor spt6 [Mycoemilia scoparia]